MGGTMQTSAAGKRVSEEFLQELNEEIERDEARLDFEDARSESRLKVVTIQELLQEPFPPREELLSPIFHTQSINMIHARRGIGKTHVALGIGYAAATGGTFLKWNALKPRGVLYLDGEMPGNVMQERLAAIIAANSATPFPYNFKILTPDLQPEGMPDLSTRHGQAEINALLTKDTELIIIDNISCLCRSGRENEAESWLPVQGWALQQRAAGRSVLFIHHSGKDGAQRGSSKREDILDTVINLKRPPDYDPTQGACFEVVIEKGRHIFGADAEPFEARLVTDTSGAMTWTIRDISHATLDRVVELSQDGLSKTEIANELGVNKSTVSRAHRKAVELGLIKAN
jgi:hypothetical protein